MASYGDIVDAACSSLHNINNEYLGSTYTFVISCDTHEEAVQFSQLIPNTLVFCTTPQSAYYQGSPTMQYAPNISAPDAILLGTLQTPPIPASKSFTKPLFIVSILVQGPVTVDTKSDQELHRALVGSTVMVGHRRIRVCGQYHESGILKKHIVLL